jgi:hypothetical protein
MLAAPQARLTIKTLRLRASAVKSFKIIIEKPV